MFRFTPIISVFLFITFLIGGYFCWRPKYQEFKQKNLSLQQATKALEEKNNYYSKLREISNKLTSYKNEISKIDSALPVEVSLPFLFSYIEKVSSTNGLVLDSVSSSVSGKGFSSENKENRRLNNKNNEEIKVEAKSGAKVKRVSFSISLSGTYLSFKKFLAEIYKSARLIEVRSIKFSSPAEGDLFKFDLTLETYALSNQKSAEETNPIR